MVVAGHCVSGLAAMAIDVDRDLVDRGWLLCAVLEHSESRRTGDDARCQLASFTLSLLGLRFGMVCREFEDSLAPLMRFDCELR